MEKESNKLYPRYKKYFDDYNKQTYKQYVFKVSKRTEPELIEYLDNKKERSSYIKDLIRKDIKSEKRRLRRLEKNAEQGK